MQLVDNEQELDFRDLVELFKRGFWWAAFAAVLAAAAAWYISDLQAPTYQATATLILSQPSTELNRFGVSLVTAPAIDVNAYREAARSSPVLIDSMTALGLTATPEALESFSEKLTVRTQENRLSSMLYIDFRSESPAEAADAANLIAFELLEWDTQRATRNLTTIVGTLEAQLAELEGQLRELSLQPGTELHLESISNLHAQQTMSLNSARALLSSAVGSLEFMEPAQEPSSRIAPSPLRNAALAGVLAVFVVYGIVLLRGALDTRVRDIDDLRSLSRRPVFAEFPKQTGLRRLPREASSYLRTNVLFATADLDPKILLVTGSIANQGKSSVALSLAESFARNGYRTLLIDADLRKPVIHSEYRIEARGVQSLPEMLAAPEEELTPVTLRFDANTSMDLVPTFTQPNNATELLNRGFKRVIDRLAPAYDIVVVDSAPVLPVADTLAIAPHTGGIIFTASLLDTDRRSVGAAFELLERLGLSVLGVVATNVPNSMRQSGGTAGYGYGYGYGNETAGADDSAPAHDAKPIRPFNP